MITNLTRFELTDDEVEVLNFGLKHGVLSRPKESEMVATMEYVWVEIDNNNILKENHTTKERVQTVLRAFTYNYLDLETKDYHLDRKRMNIIQNPREKVMIALVSKDDYIRNTECLFSDKTKFQVLHKDLTLQSLNRTKLFKYIIQSWGNIKRQKEKYVSKIWKNRQSTWVTENSQKILRSTSIPTHSRHCQDTLLCHFNPLTQEAVARTCSVKKVFLEILQNSQENTCARISFLMKLQALLG